MRTRLVEIADAAALMAIYNPEVLETTNTFDLVPRTLAEQEEWIRHHMSSHPCIVAINEADDVGEAGARGERILGFALFSPFRSRPAYASTVENSPRNNPIQISYFCEGERNRLRRRPPLLPAERPSSVIEDPFLMEQQPSQIVG